MKKKVDASALAQWMSRDKGIKQPPDVWQAGSNLAQPEVAPARGRKKSERTARIEVRVSPDERRRFELFAVREGVTASEVFSRMLALYEREHGKLEVRRADESK
jgi:predicted nucleic acid-binding protein